MYADDFDQIPSAEDLRAYLTNNEVGADAFLKFLQTEKLEAPLLVHVHNTHTTHNTQHTTHNTQHTTQQQQLQQQQQQQQH